MGDRLRNDSEPMKSSTFRHRVKAFSRGWGVDRIKLVGDTTLC